MTKIITASIWSTTHGAFPRKMEDVNGTMEQVLDRMRVFNPKIALMDARDMIRRAAFQTDHAWTQDRSIGIKVESVATDRIMARDPTELAGSIDLMNS